MSDISKKVSSGPLKELSDTFKVVSDKDDIYKIKKIACTDEMDIRIIDLLKDGVGIFEDSDKINYSAIAKEIGTYDNDIRRRIKKILKKLKEKSCI
jgi:hypothetical protein